VAGASGGGSVRPFNVCVSPSPSSPPWVFSVLWPADPRPNASPAPPQPDSEGPDEDEVGIMRDIMHAEDVRTAKLELLEHQKWRARMAAERERNSECQAAWWVALEGLGAWRRRYNEFGEVRS